MSQYLQYAFRSIARQPGLALATVLTLTLGLGLNVGVSPEDGAWRVGVFARNLLDEHFVSAIFPNFFDPQGYAQAPAVEGRRTVGVMLDFNFGP